MTIDLAGGNICIDTGRGVVLGDISGRTAGGSGVFANRNRYTDIKKY